ncbi:MAG: hypothetical protein WC917_00520 [Bacilli bacterium]|jgi:hypothetical protein
MSNNIITYTNRVVCELLSDGDYVAEIVKTKKVSRGERDIMIVDLIVDGGSQGKLDLTKWLPDSSDKRDIMSRKQLFTAIGHPEWFEQEKFDITQLIGFKVMVSLDSYTSTKFEKLVNNIREFKPMPKGQQTVDDSMANDDIGF